MFIKINDPSNHTNGNQSKEASNESPGSPFWLTMADLAAGVVNAEALAAKARVAAAESFIIYFCCLGLGAKQRNYVAAGGGNNMRIRRSSTT